MPNGGDMLIDTLSGPFLPDMCTNGIPALSMVLKSAIRQDKMFSFPRNLGTRMIYLYGMI